MNNKNLGMKKKTKNEWPYQRNNERMKEQRKKVLTKDTNE